MAGRRRFAFDYLDDLQKEFVQLHGQQIDSVERPYKFITFDTFIQKTKKLYMDTRANRNHLKMMSDDLRDIQGIMTKNIQEVLGRGEKLESEPPRPAPPPAPARRASAPAHSEPRPLPSRQGLPPSRPHRVDTSRPSLRTNWTCLVPAAGALTRSRTPLLAPRRVAAQPPPAKSPRLTRRAPRSGDQPLEPPLGGDEALQGQGHTSVRPRPGVPRPRASARALTARERRAGTGICSCGSGRPL